MSDNRTTELREKLDSLSIEHFDYDKGGRTQTQWEAPDGKRHFTYETSGNPAKTARLVIAWHPTPEQAIAATLDETRKPPCNGWFCPMCAATGGAEFLPELRKKNEAMNYHVEQQRFRELPDKIVVHEDGYYGAWKDYGEPIVDYVYTLGGGECEVECFDDGVDEGMDGEWYSYAPPTWYLSCGHDVQGTERPNYCAVCGKAVKR